MPFSISSENCHISIRPQASYISVETIDTLCGEVGKNRLEAGERGVFTVDKAMEKVVEVMSSLEKENSGTVIDWEGKQIPLDKNRDRVLV